MMKVQRRFGKMLPRTADESQVSVLLKDFEDADKMLAKIIDASKAWRDAWLAILDTQHNLAGGFLGLYQPIIGAGETHNGHEAVETPEDTIERTDRLVTAYDDLKTELQEEVNMVNSMIVSPATDAKDSIQPIKKVIKKREDRKLDFERYQGRVDASKKKLKRSDRDNAALAKSEKDLARATEEYNDADTHLKSTLPPVITAAFSLLPYLLNNQIIIQNNMLAQYYTTLHNYCEDMGFPSPAPPVETVIQTWEDDFSALRLNIESEIEIISTGKTVRTPMKQEDQTKGGTMTGMNIRNGIRDRRTSSNKPDHRQALTSPPPVPRIMAPVHSHPDDQSGLIPVPSPSSSSAISSPPAYSGSSTPASDYFNPAAGGSHSPAAPRTDYFARDRIPSSSSLSSVAMAKKKPPPPPPPKKRALTSTHYVTAQYSFEGEGHGDLAFNEGDRIKVIKKTDNTEDWWEGELGGRQGSFPANYCK